MNTIAVRRMAFDFPQDMDLVFIPGDPIRSYALVGTWLALPYLEPYLIRTIQAATSKVADPVLLDEMKRFCAQEGQHYRQHARANDVIRARNPAYAPLVALEAALQADFERFTATKSLRFNLAYAEGFEAMTAAMARTMIDLGLFEGAHPLAKLTLWHLMEELEHRTVAFDAYEAAAGGYLYRLVVGVWAQWHFLSWMGRMSKVMLQADAEMLAPYRRPEMEARRRAMRRRYLKLALPRLLSIYLPWYSPRRITLPDNFTALQARFTAMAASVA